MRIRGAADRDRAAIAALGRKGALLHVVAANARALCLYLSLGGRPDGIEDKNLCGTLVSNERFVWDDLTALAEF